MKRLFDIFFSALGLIIFLPILILFCFLIWLQDFQSPFYKAVRVGKHNRQFTMYKLRTMRVNADQTGVESTSSDDSRITSLGKFIRLIKMDELSQLLNVLKGDMSLVGPRPNTIKGVSVYSQDELNLLSTKPGITDISSIVFSDEGSILAGEENPDLAYDQIIRPWKSKLGLLYINNQNLLLDLKLIMFTILAIFKKKLALFFLNRVLIKLTDDNELIEVAKREHNLSNPLA